MKTAPTIPKARPRRSRFLRNRKAIKMMYKRGRETVRLTPQRIIPMSLTELSLGGFLARMARLRFTRPGQCTKTQPAAAHRRQRTKPEIEDNVTFLKS